MNLEELKLRITTAKEAKAAEVARKKSIAEEADRLISCEAIKKHKEEIMGFVKVVELMIQEGRTTRQHNVQITSKDYHAVSETKLIARTVLKYMESLGVRIDIKGHEKHINHINLTIVTTIKILITIE